MTVDLIGLFNRRCTWQKDIYKALRPNAKPQFDTINRVCAAFGVRLVAEPARSQGAS